MTDYQVAHIDSQTVNSKKVLLIYTGGTLGMAYDDKVKSLVPFNFDQILTNIPELRRLELDLDVLSFTTPIDSSNVSVGAWIELATIIEKYYEQYQGFVILHGTDTMAYTASALSFMIQDLTKPIILTGAQLPIGLPRTDARENLISSIEIAGCLVCDQANVPEVCIYFNGRLLRGNRSKKQESSHFDAFESENLEYLANIGVVIEYNNSIIRKASPKTKPSVYKDLSVEVGILKLFPGISEATVAHFFSQLNLKGVVLETYGAGNAPSEDWFLREIEKASNRGIIILNVSQCVGGKVMMGKYETSKKLEKLGLISGSDITTEAAITKMMWALANFEDRSQIIEILAKDIAGEMS